MQLSIVDEYPTGAAFGCDYFTRASRGDVTETGPDGPKIRPEKVVITDRYLDDEGQICVGERTIRHLAHRFAMVDGWRVEIIASDNEELREELVELSMQLAQSRVQMQNMRDLETTAPREVYVALDGSKHASRRGSIEASASALGLQPTAIMQAISVPVDLDDPATQEAK